MRTKDKIINPTNLLLKPKSILIVDLLKHVLRITDSNLIECLKEPEQGMYAEGGSIPILKEGHKYYPASQWMVEDKHIEIDQSMFSVYEDILDTEGNVVVKKARDNLRKRLFTFNPPTTITGVQLAASLVTNLLNVSCPYVRSLLCGNANNYLKEEYQNSIIYEDMENTFSDLLDEVYEFIGEDTWFIYFTKMIGNAMIIEKVVDYRIYRYHEITYNEYMETQEALEEDYEQS